MAGFVEVLGGMLAELFSWRTGYRSDDRNARAAVLVDGHWEEGTLYLGDTELVWNNRMVFSSEEGLVIEAVDEDEAWMIAPNMVVLHYVTADGMTQLAVHQADLEKIDRVLPLPSF
ncbi:hypothetical protein FKR81_07600 [Lentzea tibetensis]|uniref:Uncharacterized protein n=1 Tax=Lentzea tibetensis TaxID=2591470 RepID=A0A563EZP4_9PSEU|nr:hypothetical protein [Lentzea tibetensis]TWP52961.1 hypothetical protein FKR81_07600 [Lentzea tibetensis]